MDEEEVARSAVAMAQIAPLFDSLESAINSAGPVDMIGAYCIALGAMHQLDMDKPMLERFVAVLMADRTYRVIAG